MTLKLKWKKKWLDDNSGYWYSAKVSILNWEYIVETTYQNGIVAGVYFSKMDDDITKISKKKFKTEHAAMNACEKHLLIISKKFKSWLESNTYET